MKTVTVSDEDAKLAVEVFRAAAEDKARFAEQFGNNEVKKDQYARYARLIKLAKQFE